MNKTTLETRKLNMTQIFVDGGFVLPVTILEMLGDVPAELQFDTFLNKHVVIHGTSKGKGFAGGMKRWGFAGGEATRGQSTKPRAPGSIGSQTPGRVRKGKKMAGRLGGDRVTIKGLTIVKVLSENKQLMVSGAVPGARNSKVVLEVLE